MRQIPQAVSREFGRACERALCSSQTKEVHRVVRAASSAKSAVAVQRSILFVARAGFARAMHARASFYCIP
jgi:hypothetical protein